MLILIVDIHVLPDQIEAFKAATIDNSTNSRKEPGCVRFDFLQDADDPTHFALHETYRDRAAVDAHRNTAHYQRWAEQAPRFLKQDRTRVFYENVDPADANY
jgi:quinol monooxygenase YgiN